MSNITTGSDPDIHRDPLPGSSPALLRSWLVLLYFFLASTLLIARCWDAPFISYDDGPGVYENDLSGLDVPWWKAFVPVKGRSYFPVTDLTVRWERWLFESAMPPAPGSAVPGWAPAVRIINAGIHALAAFFLWNILQRLGLRRGAAFALSLLFAIHPIACEPVAWAAETKTELCGMFGFAALWSSLAFTGRWWGLPLACSLFTLALLSKPSALGLLPLFMVIEVLPAAYWKGEGSLLSTVRACLKRSVWRMIPILLICGLIIGIGVDGHQTYLVPPLGGTFFTNLLTDFIVLGRYMENIIFPFNLSAAYAIRPILAVTDPRLWLRLFELGLLMAITIKVADSPRRACLGWFLFFTALVPMLNFIAIPYPMTDRYVYCSVPGLLLALYEGFSGALKFLCGHRRVVLAGLRIGVTVVAVSVLGWVSIERSQVWRGVLPLFKDAVDKEPQAAFAQYGYGLGLLEEWGRRKNSPDPTERLNGEAYQLAGIASWENYFKTVDLDRQQDRPRVALSLGNYFLSTRDFQKARFYLQEALRSASGVRSAVDEDVKREAQGKLVSLP